MYQIAPDGTNLEQILIEVHRGFNEMFELYDDVKAKINDLNLDTNAVLYVNGHSLGGANAMLFAVHYAFSNPTKQVELTTFGAPRVGNRGLKLFAERLKNLNIWRIVNLKDAIPRVPVVIPVAVSAVELYTRGCPWKFEAVPILRQNQT